MTIKIEATSRLLATSDLETSLAFIKSLGLVPNENKPPRQQNKDTFEIDIVHVGGIAGFMMTSAKITKILGVHPSMKNHDGYPIAKWDLDNKRSITLGTNGMRTYVKLEDHPE